MTNNIIISEYFKTLEEVSKEKSITQFGSIQDSFLLGYSLTDIETLLELLNLTEEQFHTLKKWTEATADLKIKKEI